MIGIYDIGHEEAKVVLDQLKHARQTLHSPDKWTRGSFARRWPSRYPVSPTNKLADCWCIRGAIRRAASVSPIRAPTTKAESLVAMVANSMRLIEFPVATKLAVWNDEQATYEQVITLLDNSIKLAEAIASGRHLSDNPIPKTER